MINFDKQAGGTLFHRASDNFILGSNLMYNNQTRLIGASLQPSLNAYIFNWDSHHARLSSHYTAWSYKEKKHKKIKA